MTIEFIANEVHCPLCGQASAECNCRRELKRDFFAEFCNTVRAVLPSANEHRLKASFMTGSTAQDCIGIFERNPLRTDLIDNENQVTAVINWEWPNCPPAVREYILHGWSWTDWAGETVETLTNAVQELKHQHENYPASADEIGRRVQKQRIRQRAAIKTRKLTERS